MKVIFISQSVTCWLNSQSLPLGWFQEWLELSFSDPGVAGRMGSGHGIGPAECTGVCWSHTDIVTAVLMGPQPGQNQVPV